MSQKPVSVAIKADGGKVIIKLDREVSYIEIDPDNMLDMVEAMTAAAFEADTTLKPVGETLKASLIEKHRDVLLPRVTLLIGGMRNDIKKSNGEMAVTMIDVIFSEIFS